MVPSVREPTGAFGKKLASYAEGADHNMQFSAPDIIIEETLKLLSTYGQVLEIG